MLFLLQRAARIYPLYWITLAVFLAIWPASLTPDRVLNSLVLMPVALPEPELLARMALPPAWTLVWEVFFYLVFAAALLSRRPAAALSAWAGLIALAHAPAVQSLIGERPPGLLGLLTDPVGLLFLGGYAASRLGRGGALPLRTAVALAAAGVLLTGWSVWLSRFGLFMPTGFADTLLGAAGLSALLCGCIALERRGRLPVGRWCLALGRLSYPIYITHWLFIGLTFRAFLAMGWDLSAHPLGYAACMLAAILAGGVAASLLVDRPIMRRLRRAIRTAAGYPAAAAHSAAAAHR